MRFFVSRPKKCRAFGILGGLAVAVLATGWSLVGQCADSPAAKGAADAAADPVPGLIKSMATGTTEARQDAIDDLADLGPKAKAAVPQLTEALKAKEAGIRWRAARALAAIGPDASDAAPALAAALGDKEHHVRSHAAYALGALGPGGAPYTKQLVALITDPDMHVRRAVVRAIGKIHSDPEIVVPAMVQALSTADPSDALAAIRSLAMYGEKAAPAAIKVLKEAPPKSKARYWACVLLAELGPKAEPGIDPLKAALSDEDPGTRMQAALALGQIGPAAKSAVPALVHVLDDDALTGVRYTAAYALGQIGDKEAVASLKKASVGKDTLLSTLSIWAIAKLEPENEQAVGKAIDAIVSAMEDKRPEVRQAAAQALWDLKAPHEKVGPALAAALNDENPEVVANVLDSLASLGEKIAPRVSTALEDPKRQARALALVERMGPQARQCVPVLVKLLGQVGDENPANNEKKEQILTALGAVGPDAAPAVAAIAPALASNDPQVVGAACFALSRIGPPAASTLPAITKQLASESIYARVAAASAVVAIEADKARAAKQALPLLTKALESDIPMVQVEAAQSLGVLGPAAKSAVPNLKSLADHGNEAVREAAGWAVGQIEKK
ncbi:MAG TPA: HEAT repeat domain-containing protein [Pirellulales bacterium]|nr:HEAT repeat domain-containing protein [Pirellulales bacterium]